jgi:hypothetical protein
VLLSHTPEGAMLRESLHMSGYRFHVKAVRALVNAEMNLRVHKMLGNCRVAAQLVACRVVLGSIELVSPPFCLIVSRDL